MGLLLPFQPPPADYPNHLASPQPERLAVKPAPWLLLGLVLLCLVLRMPTAVSVPSICVDGVIYVNAARALEAGNFRAALWEGGLNIYPVILMLLHRLGLDWEAAAGIWGVTVSSLVVLPLWGWARRQFDDRVALVACLLYAVHPRFIIESPEVMRDPTFWFFFMLAIYWLWRAATEVSHCYFILAGAAITLASLTRVEGLFLLIPLGLWSFWRLLALRRGRGKLLLGATLCVVVFPLLLALVNAAWLSGHSDWAIIRLSPLDRVRSWLESMLGHETVGVGDGLDPPMHVGQMIWRFFPTLTRSFSPVFALLMFGGIWGWRRLWARRDHQALFYTAVVILCGIWIQLWYDRYFKNISPRYALPIVLMAAPFAALGLLALATRVLRFAEKRGWRAGSRRVAIVAVMALVVAPGMADVLNNNLSHSGRRRMAIEAGRWLKREWPTPPTIVGPPDVAPVVAYYAGSDSYVKYRYDESEAAILGLVTQNKADVVLLRSLAPRRRALLAERVKRLGLEPVGPDVLPRAGHDFHLFVRANGREVGENIDAKAVDHAREAHCPHSLQK